MVLSTKQAEQLRGGTLTKANFKKLIDTTADISGYLFRYCTIHEEHRTEIYRETTFKVFGYLITIGKINGEQIEFKYKIL